MLKFMSNPKSLEIKCKNSKGGQSEVGEMKIGSTQQKVGKEQGRDQTHQ